MKFFKFIPFLALSCVSLFFTSLYSEIIETPHFSEITSYIKENTLVICDIDDTLLIPTQTLGSDVWFIYRVNTHKKAGLSDKEALFKAISEWEAVRQMTGMQLVEESSASLLKELQNKNICIMGLTTQGLALATCTVQQLQKLDIHLEATAPSQEDCYFINGHGVLYRKGVLFTSGTPKGKALLTLLENIHYKPEHIVFINDKSTHLKDVEDEVTKAGIAFTGLRYSYSDERVANFNPEIADLQWKYSSFEHILSDEEAMFLKDLIETVNCLK